jgi:dGTPase
MKKLAIERKLAIENSHPFIKMEEISQILIPKSNKKDIFRTRQTHSYETATIARIIAYNIGYINVEELENVCLLHDLGHPPFGHKGAEYLDSKSKELGLEEGFSDNNATFEVIKNNSIEISNYELVSLIKYPKKLYSYQKKYLIPLLNIEINKEKREWGESLNRTVACEIMDMADRIAYGTSDIVDSFSTGFTNKTLPSFLLEISETFSTNRNLYEIIYEAYLASKDNNKKLLRKKFIDLKLFILNDLYWNKEESKLLAINPETINVLNSICKFSFNFFIRDSKVHSEIMKGVSNLDCYFTYMLNNPEKMPSKFYYRKYKLANTEIDKIRTIRDMVADSTDKFISEKCLEI